MSDIKKIVILGAGYGGVHAAKLLVKNFKKDDNVEITLIDKNSYHTLLTEIHEVAGNRVQPESVKIDLNKIFAAKKVKVCVDEIKKLDFDKKQLISDDATYDYDYLILGAGSEPAFFGVAGVKENGFTLWSLNDALKIKQHIKDTFETASREKNLEKRMRLLTFIVAGAGFTGIETVGELLDWKKRLCVDYKVDETEVKLMVVEAMGKILPILSDTLIAKSERYLKKRGVDLKTNSPIIEVSKDSIKLKDGTVIPTETLIWTCGVQNNAFSASLDLTKGRASRLKTNEFMQSIDHKEVYIVGDNSYYEETAGKGLPQIVETALQTAETVAKNITAEINEKEKEAFKSNYHGFMVSMGSRYAVANVGGMSISGFFAMAIKHLINIHYIFSVGGFNTIWAYIMHEFFEVKDNRSMIGGHAAKDSPTFWLAILRVFIGVKWLIEGITKISQGWLSAEHIYIVNVAGVSGATAAATTTTTVATVVPLISTPPGWYTWFMNTFIAPYAHFFQSTIVLTEVAIGLALVGGLFTVIASFASIFLAINFILSAMGGSEIFWYIFGAIAILGGSGRALGLDYYVMPWLKRWWNGTTFAQKTYLYIGEPTTKF